MGLNPKIKETAIVFLYVELKQDPYIDFLCCHPYTNNWIVFDGKNYLDLHDKNNVDKWRSYVGELLDKADNLGFLFMLLDKRYYLTFLQHTLSYLSSKELGEILAIIWPSLENPSSNTLFTNEELLQLFVKADKSTLMKPNDEIVYSNLKSNLTVYRGINTTEENVEISDKYWRSLSWTTDYKRAEWYAKRWSDIKSNSTMIVFETVILKEDIIATFEYENEIILNFGNIKSENVKVHILEKD